LLSGLSATSALTLAPGEVVKNSGKFTKPTKIPGKNYSKDEIIIRNSDSGKGELERNIFKFILSTKKIVET
jgi:hypothetical protein